jgi:peptidyl-prolyl cis-trans isomerase C
MALRAVIALALAALIAAPALAAEKKSGGGGCGSGSADDPVVACVNNTPIRKREVVEEVRNLSPEMRREPIDKLWPLLMNQSVAQVLMEQAARRDKLNKDPEVERRIKLAERALLVDIYAERVARKELTDEKLRQYYSKYAASRTGEEVCARHILLPTEAEAKAVIAELDKGADFATLARDKTTDPGGKASGGDLGCFTRDEMVKEFADAAFALKKGEMTQTPVKSHFGYHVIKVEDRRPAKAAPFDEVKDNLRYRAAHEIVERKVQELAKEAKIEVFNPDGSKIATRAPAAPPAPAPAQGSALDGSGDAGRPAEGVPVLSPATAPDQLQKK